MSRSRLRSGQGHSRHRKRQAEVWGQGEDRELLPAMGWGGEGPTAGRREEGGRSGGALKTGERSLCHETPRMFQTGGGKNQICALIRCAEGAGTQGSKLMSLARQGVIKGQMSRVASGVQGAGRAAPYSSVPSSRPCLFI